MMMIFGKANVCHRPEEGQTDFFLRLPVVCTLLKLYRYILLVHWICVAKGG